MSATVFRASISGCRVRVPRLILWPKSKKMSSSFCSAAWNSSVPRERDRQWADCFRHPCMVRYSFSMVMDWTRSEVIGELGF